MDNRQLKADSKMKRDFIHLSGRSARWARVSRGRLLVICFGLFLTVSPATSGNAGWTDGAIVISTQEETARDMALAPCKNNERLMATRALFVKLGAREDEVSIETQDGVENLVLRKIGKSQGTIVIGAHYDKVLDGCGAIDNWSGIVTLVHIYRSLKDVPLKKSLIFVAFGKEESGLLGSRAMVKAIKKEDVEQYCAMVNIDSLGMAAPQVLVDLSSNSLVGRVVDLAQRMKIPFKKVSIDNGTADSISFIRKKIPAITISAIGDGWERVLHTDEDRLKGVNQTSVYLGYRLALALVGELSELPCEVSRVDATRH